MAGFSFSPHSTSSTSAGTRNLHLAIGVIFFLAIVFPLGQYLHSYTSMTVKDVSSSATLSLLRWYSSSTAYTITPTESLKTMLKEIDSLNQEVITLRTSSIAAGNITQLTFVETEFKARWSYSYAHTSLSYEDVRHFYSTGKVFRNDRPGTNENQAYFGYALLRSYDHVYRYLNELYKVSLMLTAGVNPPSTDSKIYKSPSSKSSDSIIGDSSLPLLSSSSSSSSSLSLKLPEITYMSTSVQASERSAFSLRKYRKKASSFPDINLSMIQSLTDLLYLSLKDPIAVSSDSSIQMKLLDNIPSFLLEEVYPDMVASSVQSQLDFMWKWIKQSRLREHSLVTASLMHFNFQQLHPFVTGNVRASQILFNLVLLKHGFPMIIVRGDQQAAEYRLKLNIAKENGNLIPLVEFLAGEMIFTMNFIKHLYQGTIDPL